MSAQPNFQSRADQHERRRTPGGGPADERTDEATGEPRYHDECYACPVGSFFASMENTSPDMMEHLLAAAHELLQVARGAIDAAEGVVDRQREARGSSAGPSRVHRIDLD